MGTTRRGARLSFALGLDRRAWVELAVLRQRRDDRDDWLERGVADLVFAF